jgi:hypothetical protein
LPHGPSYRARPRLYRRPLRRNRARLLQRRTAIGSLDPDASQRISQMRGALTHYEFFCVPLRPFRDNCICSNTMCICAHTDLAMRSRMHEGCVDGSHRQSRHAKKLSAETSLPSAFVQLRWSRDRLARSRRRCAFAAWATASVRSTSKLIVSQSRGRMCWERRNCTQTADPMPPQSATLRVLSCRYPADASQGECAPVRAKRCLPLRTVANIYCTEHEPDRGKVSNTKSRAHR